MLCSYPKKLPPGKWNICKHVFSKLQTLGVAGWGGAQFKGLTSTKKKTKMPAKKFIISPSPPRQNLLFLSLNGPNTHPVTRLKNWGIMI